MKKFILGLTIGLIIAGSIGVYAAIKIQAYEIGYKDTTVEATLNDLYTTQDTTVSNLQADLNSYKSKFDTQTIYLTGVSYSSTRVGRALLSLGYYKDKYSKYKIVEQVALDAYPISSCNILSYNSVNQVDDALSLNTEYLTATHGDIKIDVKSAKDGNNGACRIKIMFYN